MRFKSRLYVLQNNDTAIDACQSGTLNEVERATDTQIFAVSSKYTSTRICTTTQLANTALSGHCAVVVQRQFDG